MREYYDLLRATSRTFAVGIEALPHPLRDAVTLAYLVLRVSDYFEDSPTLAVQRKVELLNAWAALVEPGAETPIEVQEEGARRLAEAALPADAELPDHTAARQAHRVLRGLASLSPGLAGPIRAHTAATTRGMAHWVARGPDFPDEAALDAYMFEVAGRVGLLLTDLFAAHSPAIGRRKATLEQHAVSFGLGLQTVNVIRGLHEDPERGWSFIPRTVLEGAGVPPESPGTPTNGPDAPTEGRDMLPEGALEDPRCLPPEVQDRVLAFLSEKAARHVSDALEYCRLLPRSERGIRIFCIIPALLASRTIRVSAGNRAVFHRSVKVPRPEVKRLVLRTRAFWFADRLLTAEGRALSRSLERPERPSPYAAPPAPGPRG